MSLINLESLSSKERSYVDRMLVKTMNNYQLTEILLKKFLYELPLQITLIENYLKVQDFEQGYMIIHKLHGSLSFCGFTEIEKIAANLETYIFAKNLKASLKTIVLLKQESLSLVSLKQKLNL